MIYSSFSSVKTAKMITVFCLALLLKTDQSWKKLHLLLSQGEKKILDIISKIRDMPKSEWDKDRGDILLEIEQLRFSNQDILDAERMLERILQEGWNISFLGAEHYPQNWLLLRSQIPPIIFFKGLSTNNTNLNSSVAVVGTTKPNNICKKIVSELVSLIVRSGCSHVSGGADGIDRIGHDATIRFGGFTRAILPCGIFHYLLPTNWKEAIEKNSMQVISPWLPTARWTNSQAVRRNQLIASISQMACIIQPSHKGGSLKVAQNLLSQNMPVFAYNPQSYAKVLTYLPDVLPLTLPDGNLNYSSLEEYLHKIKNFKNNHGNTFLICETSKKR